MAFGIDPAQVVDAEVVGDAPQVVSRPPARKGVIDISQAYQDQGLAAPAADALALSDQRARAAALFLRIPFLTFVALSPKLPALVRLGAGALAVWDAYSLATQEKQIEALLPVEMR